VDCVEPWKESGRGRKSVGENLLKMQQRCKLLYHFMSYPKEWKATKKNIR
jgi:hypothetical protein